MRWNASEPSLASTVIFQGVDSLGHAITVDSRQIRFEFMLLEKRHCMKTESTKSYNFLKETFFLSSSLSRQICDVTRADMPKGLCFRLCRRDASLENRFKEDSRLSVTFV